MSDELDLETRIELAIISLNALKIKLEELDKQLTDAEEMVQAWRQ